MTHWVVYEANSVTPHVFTSEDLAIAYRNKRLRQDRVRHQVYIAPCVIDE